MAFGRKKKNEEPKKETLSYKDWESDFGFLNLILNRKKGISKEFLIKTYSKQKQNKDIITDDEIAPVIENIITEVISCIGENYKKFLIEKYFGTIENLVLFVSEDVYVDILTDTINENSAKLKRSIQNQVLENLSKQ